MVETPTPTLPRTESLQHVLERAALPLLLFSAVLFLLLFVSWFGILPRFTRFAVANVSLSPMEMETYVSAQKEELSTLEQKRNRLVLPTNDAAYDALKAEKRNTQSAIDVQSRLTEAATQLGETPDVIHFTHISVNESTSTVVVEGDVRNVGPRSMTVLATFVQTVEALPFIEHLKHPAFERLQNADGSLHSPFSLSFTLGTHE